MPPIILIAVQVWELLLWQAWSSWRSIARSEERGESSSNKGADVLLKDYLIRYVNVKAEHTISWSIRPDKKSINFGIFKHPGSSVAQAPNLAPSSFESPATPGLQPEDTGQESHCSKNTSSTAIEKLKSTGLKLVKWHGSCEANKVSNGTYDIPKDEGGNYALVFDNTFSKSFAKSATFVLLTYPRDSPPQSNHHVKGALSECTTNTKDPSNTKKAPLKHKSSDTGLHVNVSNSAYQASDATGSITEEGSETAQASNFFTGILHKRRRKRHQGWARRFFSLDYTSSTLSYYQTRNSRAVRGAIPLSLAAIGANAKTRQISIDSGAEVWHLKAANQKEFQAWKDALERARTATSPENPANSIKVDMRATRLSVLPVNPEEEREWARIEELSQRLKGSRDAAKLLAKDTDPKYLSLDTLQPPTTVDSNPISSTSSASGSPSEPNANSGYFNGTERKPFWKRKPSSDARPMPGMFRSVSATPSTKSLATAPPTPIRATAFVKEGRNLHSHPEDPEIESVHSRCMSLMKDLDSIVADMTLLCTESKRRRAPSRPFPIHRHSIDTQGSIDEYFDAEGMHDSQFLAIHHESDDEGDGEDHGYASDADSSASEVEEPTRLGEQELHHQLATPLFPSKPKSLVPLPAEKIKRRNTVTPPTQLPPSIIGHLRKNVGKDLSSISMPVSSNEPLSLLQRVSEILEYSDLLDQAANKAESSTERLIYVTAFAISNLSSARMKERAIRKPFNPMLGETFELVREDRGFRFVAEKVSHRPVRLACQAESESWTLAQSPLPTQKFWGKSAELITEGKVRVSLHTTGDHFSWNIATSFLRNIIAGEKYVEPVGTISVVNETTNEKAVVTFKAKGMFSGRSEDVEAETFDAYGDKLALGLTGKWTSSLTITEQGQARSDGGVVWTADDLVADAAKHYGFTTFASSLNEITALEKGKLPPTDSRLRPDQRAAEDGDLDRAEVLKSKLEDEQRKRRKAMEDEGTLWTPKWFEKVKGGDGGEEVWVAKGGKDSYWERRKVERWEGVEKIFDVDCPE